MGSPPEDVVRAWFAAHARGDLEAARSLLDPQATIAIGRTRLRGFDEFMAWYQQRVAAQPGFTYEVVDLLAGQRHAAAVLILRFGDGTAWRQVALYETREGYITAITTYEDAPETDRR